MKRIIRPIEKWPRELTPKDQRRRSPFICPGKKVPGADGQSKRTNSTAMPLSRTYADLDRELKHFGLSGGGAEVIIERALRDRDIRQDGELRADAANPKHPGVILTFTGQVGGRPTPLSFACNAFDHWEDNLRAIVLTLEHLRGADRYGVTKSGEQYRGWNALPPAMALSMTVEEASRTLAKFAGSVLTAQNAAIIKDPAVFKTAWRTAVDKYHPDHNDGDVLQEWHTLQDVRKVLDRHHKL